MLSVLLFPLIALLIRRGGGTSRERALTDDVHVPTEG